MNFGYKLPDMVNFQINVSSNVKKKIQICISFASIRENNVYAIVIIKCGNYGLCNVTAEVKVKYTSNPILSVIHVNNS